MNLQIVYLLQYENYYNRKQPRPKATIGEYSDYILYTQEYMNFNPNDQVNAELIMNTIEKDANYAIICNDDGTIASRWYVIGSVRLAGGQWRFTLRRDLIADFYDDILYAPATIHRGKLRDTDPFILNDEGISFNQIKQKETLLKDETQVPWIVGYVAQPQDGEESESITASQRTGITPDFTAETPSDWEYNDYTAANAVGYPLSASFTYRITASSSEFSSSDTTYDFTFGANTNNAVEKESASTVGLASLRYAGMPSDFADVLETEFLKKKTEMDNAGKEFVAEGSDALVAELLALDGKTILFGTDDYREIKVRHTRVERPYNISTTTKPDFYQYMTNFALNTELASGDKLFTGSANGSSFRVVCNQEYYWVTYTPLTVGVLVSKDRNVLFDAPYCMFAIPYGEITLEGRTIGGKEIATFMAAALAEKLTSAKIYDIQLLPYCPFRKAIVNTNEVQISNCIINRDYDFITDTDGGLKSILFWAQQSQFTFAIEDNRGLPRGKKTVNQCYMSRLCSPNYASIYEFSLAKNNGLAGFSVDCAYKPYSPYIHVYPRPPVGSFYGRDFDDARGLICAGDFSMPATSDQWELYELNNKNYQNMFNRQIQTMDLTHKMERISQGVNIGVGAISSGMSAIGTAGFVSGFNPAAMVGGGIAGTALSVGAGIADYAMAEELRKDARSAAFDTFRMSNENIQAMPDTLTKVSAFNPNNKIFPIYEEYAATAREIAAFENYIKYNGMKVERVGTIKEFEYEDEQFVSATIIRFNDTFDANAYIAAEINNELQKGVYIKQ